MLFISETGGRGGNKCSSQAMMLKFQFTPTMTISTSRTNAQHEAENSVPSIVPFENAPTNAPAEKALVVYEAPHRFENPQKPRCVMPFLGYMML